MNQENREIKLAEIYVKQQLCDTNIVWKLKLQ